MRRCGKDVPHDQHVWREWSDDPSSLGKLAPMFECDGRTTNEAAVGVLTVRELAERLADEQGGAVVAVRLPDGLIAPCRMPDIPTGRPVFLLDLCDPASGSA